MAQNLSDLQTIITDFIKELSAEGVDAEKVILYGSQARGNASKDSDIDLVVISKDLAKYPILERLTFLSRVAWKCNGPLEVLGYTPDEVKDKEGKSIIWDEICETGRIVYQAT